MKIQKFEDLIVWQKSIVITVKLYRHFEKHPDFGYSNQIRRASVSISNNIAEGSEYNNNKQFIRFLKIAKGSCAEVRSMLVLCKELGFSDEIEIKESYNLTIEISQNLSNFIKYLSEKIK